MLAVNIGLGIVPPYSLTSVFGGINPLCMGQMAPVNLTTLGGLTAGSGSNTWNFAIPNNPAFADLLISAQGLFLDFFAPGGLVTSNGGQVLTGAQPRTTVLSAAGAPTTLTTGALQNNYCPVAFFDHQ